MLILFWFWFCSTSDESHASLRSQWPTFRSGTRENKQMWSCIKFNLTICKTSIADRKKPDLSSLSIHDWVCFQVVWLSCTPYTTSLSAIFHLTHILPLNDGDSSFQIVCCTKRPVLVSILLLVPWSPVRPPSSNGWLSHFAFPRVTSIGTSHLSDLYWCSKVATGRFTRDVANTWC